MTERVKLMLTKYLKRTPAGRADLRVFHFFSILVLTIIVAGCETSGEKSTSIRPHTEEPQPTENILNERDLASYSLAKAYINQEKTSLAENTLVFLVKKHPNNSDIWLNLATCYFIQGKLQQADEATNKALQLNNTIPETHNLMGLIAVENKQFKKAETEYLLALTLNNDFANAHYNTALLYDIYFQNIKKALYHYTQYLTLIPSDDIRTRDWVNQLKASLAREN
jgi:tetratricopeptide (TPR) repeat protein